MAEAADVGAEHDRYRFRRDVIEAALGSTADVPAGRLAAVFAAIADETLTALASNPAEPLLLNYAGVAAYELGDLEAGESLFRAASGLDPDLPDVRSNIDAIERRRREADSPRRLPPDVTAALPGIRRRARELVRRAIPRDGLRLSLCMIVKDEREMLPRSLAAAKDAVDEIIVVDTGSSDGTVEIARSFGATVIEREWTGSFAEARNASLEAATGDWILYLDADEVLVAEDAPLLRELCGRTWREAFYLVETNHTGHVGAGAAVNLNALRMFRNRPEYRFEGRVHEQFAQNLPAGQPERLELTCVRVEHFGYLGGVRDAKEKSRRNRELIERQREEVGATPCICFNLGSEYAAAGEAEDARAEFEQAWDLLHEDRARTNYGFVPSLTSRLVKSLRATGRLEKAIAVADEGLALFPGFTDLVFEQGLALLDRGDVAAAIEKFDLCLAMGDAPSRYSATVGCGTTLPLIALGELRRDLGEAAAAEALFARCLADHPGYVGSIRPLAQITLARGATAPETIARIVRGVEQMTSPVRFMLATALYEAGAASEAEPLLRAVVEQRPQSSAARLALAEALLSLRRYDDAAAEAVEAGDHGSAAASARTELFALLVAGRPAAAALERAYECGLPAAEQRLFEAWEEATRLGSGFPPLDPVCAGLLFTMLEALLRVGEFAAFEGLVPAVEATGIAGRDRHQLLAELYVRRGLLASAVDEWIAACEEAGPDPAALSGLARVATARGLDQEAALFQREAERLTHV